MIKTAFVDSDGVVADLHSGLAEIFGFDMTKWPKAEYDIGVAFGRTQREIWTHSEVATAAFWRGLPVLPWARDLMEYLNSTFGQDNVCFLTQPVRDCASLAGKAMWFKDHFPGNHFLIGSNKRFCAGRDKVLIDDHSEKVDTFRFNGGRGILFPRPWNVLHLIEDPMAFVRRELELML